jgi:hypothetical protein
MSALPACGVGHHRHELAGHRLQRGLVDLVGVGGELQPDQFARWAGEPLDTVEQPRSRSAWMPPSWSRWRAVRKVPQWAPRLTRSSRGGETGCRRPAPHRGTVGQSTATTGGHQAGDAPNRLAACLASVRAAMVRLGATWPCGSACHRVSSTRAG